MHRAFHPQADVELRKDLSQLRAVKTKETRV